MDLHRTCRSTVNNLGWQNRNLFSEVRETVKTTPCHGVYHLKGAHATMKVLFDNNAFATLVQQPEVSHDFQRLKELIRQNKVAVVGSCTLLHELAGLARVNTEMYLRTLSAYSDVIQGTLLRFTNDLVISEGEQLKPSGYDSSLLSKDEVQYLLQNLKNPNNARDVFLEASRFKAGFADKHRGWMPVYRFWLLPGIARATPETVAVGYQDWFKRFDAHIQDWYLHLFQPKIDFPARQLPHVIS